MGIALTQYAEEYTKIHHITVDLRLSELDLSNLAPAVQIGLYRILQEALTNVARHSEAKAVSIIFRRSHTALEITVTDDGRGFDPQAVASVPSKHLGMQSMRERAAMMGGTLSFRSEGRGGAILVCIPLPETDSRPSVT